MRTPLTEPASSVATYPAAGHGAVGCNPTRVPAAALGLNGLAVRLLWVQVALLVATAALFNYTHLSLDWASAGPTLAVDGVLAALWASYYCAPGTARQRPLAEALAVLVLVLSLTHILTPAQYAAAALDRPLIDHVLASGDAMLGVHVPALVRWTRSHVFINQALAIAYFTFLTQCASIIPTLAIVLRDREGLWEYAFHFHFCALLTVTALAVWPAACAFQYYGFESTINQARFIHHFNGLRDGSMTIVRMNDLEGLISVPSFHVAGALMVTWACRRHRRLLVPVVILNAALVAATFMSGAHYAIDTLITIPMFAASVAVYRKWAAPLHRNGLPETIRPVSESGRGMLRQPPPSTVRSIPAR